jgi:hypothetical protein
MPHAASGYCFRIRKRLAKAERTPQLLSSLTSTFTALGPTTSGNDCPPYYAAQTLWGHMLFRPATTPIDPWQASILRIPQMSATLPRMPLQPSQAHGRQRKRQRAPVQVGPVTYVSSTMFFPMFCAHAQRAIHQYQHRLPCMAQV